MFSATDIYVYEVAGITLHADPLTIRRHLLIASSGRCWEWAKRAKELALLIEAVGETEGEQADAQRAEWSKNLAELDGQLAEAAYSGFGLDRIDPETGFGTTEVAALEILHTYLEWIEKKDEKPNG